MFHKFKQLYTAYEAAQVLLKDWSQDDYHDDDESKTDLVIFPPQKVDVLTGHEEVNENKDSLGNILSNHVTGSFEIDTNCDFGIKNELLQFTA